MKDVLLDVRKLGIAFRLEDGWAPVVDNVSFSIRRGETLGLMGESGCGKSVTALSILRLLDSVANTFTGAVIFEGVNLLGLPPRELRKVRGGKIAMVFQEPASALNPFVRVGAQLVEAMCEHLDLTRQAAWARGAALLEEMGISKATECMNAYPHEISGGMRQRALMALALACRPQLLIADEPTTALDAATQAQVLKLLRDLKVQQDLTLLIISHDLGVIAELAQTVAVMYAGQIVESGPTEEIFHRPSHPYTKQLLAAAAQLYAETKSNEPLPIIEGSAPSLGQLPSGCRFHPRCVEADSECARRQPDLFPIQAGQIPHSVRCLKREHLRVEKN